jgi:hypothetical protein
MLSKRPITHETNFAQLLLGTMYMGVVVILLRPVLLKVVRISGSEKGHNLELDARLQYLAWTW